ncbi:MAG: hypothetical protein RBT65_11490 [Methanolobus sp.]|jgi:hypothetical protein|nr:hypothetical protein [Methanolobus sp.]
MKERAKLIISAGIVILAGIIAVSILLQEAPVVIQIEGESFKIIEIPYSYTTGEAYLLLTCGFFSGLVLHQIVAYLNIHPFASEKCQPGEEETLVSSRTAVYSKTATKSSSTSPDVQKILLMALVGDEKKMVQTIVQNGGQILQNELVNRLDFSKAKTSRILSNLEKKRIISKQKYGLTNCVSLTEEIRG